MFGSHKAAAKRHSSRTMATEYEVLPTLTLDAAEYDSFAKPITSAAIHPWNDPHCDLGCTDSEAGQLAFVYLVIGRYA